MEALFNIYVLLTMIFAMTQKYLESFLDNIFDLYSISEQFFYCMYPFP
jgi:hypothetical protein